MIFFACFCCLRYLYLSVMFYLNRLKASLKELLKQSENKIFNNKDLVFYCFECNNSFTIKKYIEHQDVKHKPKN